MNRLVLGSIIGILAVSAVLVALFYPISEYPPAQIQGPPAFVEEIEILIMESFPVQVNVVAKGYLPNPCRRIGRIDVARTFYGDFGITINTLIDSDLRACVQMIVQFEEVIPLNVTGHRAGIYKVTFNNPDNSTISANFELQHDNFVKVLKSCTNDSECELPMYYAVQSNCPFGTACIDNECRVVCPFTYHDPDPNVSQSYPIPCESDGDCDCSDREGRTLECRCHDGKCVSVEY